MAPSLDVAFHCERPQNITKVLQGRIRCFPHTILVPWMCSYLLVSVVACLFSCNTEAVMIESPLTSLIKQSNQHLWPADTSEKKQGRVKMEKLMQAEELMYVII